MGHEATREQVVNYLVDAPLHEIEAILREAGKLTPLLVRAVPGHEPEPEVQAEWDVWITRVPANKRIPVCKAIRNLTGMGLRESLAVVDSVPVCVREGLPSEESCHMATLLQAAGASTEVK